MKKRYEGYTYLLNIDKNSKTVKGQKQGYMTAILYLAPHTIAGYNSVCPNSTPGCRSSCLYSAGHGAYDNVKKARIARTHAFFKNKEQFMNDLVAEIMDFKIKAKAKGLIPVVRLNGTSDINWDFEFYSVHAGKRVTIFSLFKDIRFYDYTKRPEILFMSKRIYNYDVTFSYHEYLSKSFIGMIATEGFNMAVVLTKEAYKEALERLSDDCIDGDTHDLRFLDEKGKIVALKAKGQANKDKTGFVVKSSYL